MEQTSNKRRTIFFAVPWYRNPRCAPFVSSLKGAIALFKSHGYETHAGVVTGDSFVQRARNRLVKQFMDSNCDTMLFLDDDMKWSPADALKLIQMPDKVIGGNYRQKVEPGIEIYPDVMNLTEDGKPVVRSDGCISAWGICMGFTKIARTAIEKLIKAYPEQRYAAKQNDKECDIHYDLFPQGVYKGRWYGEDYSFCRLWRNIGGKIWVMPDIDIVHYSLKDAYPGNFHEYLKRLPGGINTQKE